VVGLAVSLAPTSPAAAAETGVSAPVSPEVVRAIEGEGRAEVVVELRTGVADHPAPDAATENGRRVALGRAARDFVEELPDGVEATTEHRDSRYVAVRVDADGAEALRNDPRVASVAINGRRTASLAKSVPAVGAPVVWQAGFLGSGQTVAILDTGVRYDHQFFFGRMLDGACFSGGGVGDPSLVPLCPGGATTGSGIAAGGACVGVDLCEHGTHVAGIAAGANGPAAAPSGVAPAAGIVALQRSRCTPASTSRAVRSISVATVSLGRAVSPRSTPIFSPRSIWWRRTVRRTTSSPRT
jgi:subtilisin family serine protease